MQTQHIVRSFDDELKYLANRIVTMGGHAERMVDQSVAALVTSDSDLARKVIEDDAVLDQAQREIDDKAIVIIAKRQPTASDLRLVMAIIKTITDLERIGDVADKIARMLTDNANKPQPPLVSLENMGRRTIKMLHDVLDAFARMDLDAALAVYKEDDKVDREYESIIRELMTYMMEDPRTIPQVLNVLWAARAIERVGDRCQHICEYIVYYVKGKDVRHTKADDLGTLLGKG